MPPSPPVTVRIGVQLTLSPETWISYALPKAASQFRVTRVIDAVAPRSIEIHCGSAKAEAQRVPVLPSTASPASKPAPSVDDAAAVLPCARFVPLAVDVGVGVAVAVTVAVGVAPVVPYTSNS